MLSMVPLLNGQEMIYYFYSNSLQAGFSRILAQSLFVWQYRLKVYENIKRHQRGGQKPRVWQQHRETHNKPTFRHVSTHTNMTTATTANTSKESHFITRSITTLAHKSRSHILLHKTLHSKLSFGSSPNRFHLSIQLCLRCFNRKNNK